MPVKIGLLIFAFFIFNTFGREVQDQAYGRFRDETKQKFVGEKPKAEHGIEQRTFGPFGFPPFNFDPISYKENVLHNKISFLFSLIPRPNFIGGFTPFNPPLSSVGQVPPYPFYPGQLGALGLYGQPIRPFPLLQPVVAENASDSNPVKPETSTQSLTDTPSLSGGMKPELPSEEAVDEDTVKKQKIKIHAKKQN